MAYTGYVNEAVRKMYGIPYKDLTAGQKKILHEDSLRRAKLIDDREQDVLKNNLKAFEDEAKMEKVLASIYNQCQKDILADVAETMAKVKKAGGEWSYANQSALTRSRGLFEQITAELNKLGQKESLCIDKGLSNIYTDQFLREVYSLGQSINVKANFNRLNPALIRKTLDYPWSGAMFSDRLWLDKEQLGKNLRIGLDISRRNLALDGVEIFDKVRRYATYAREEINQIGGYYAFSKELINGDSIFDFDDTKLSISTLDVGLAGIEVYDILRDTYDIQVEFGDLGNILAYLSVGDKKKNIERLISALYDIRKRHRRSRSDLLETEYISPEVALSPQEAFYAAKTSVPLEDCAGGVCGEFVMSYPPGIPILAPGERITPRILDTIRYSKAKGCVLTGPESMDISRLNLLSEVGTHG